MTESNANTLTVLAVAAHPDDIEFMMGGTLLMLKRAGYQIHYLNIANGNRGSQEYDSQQTIEIREQEARQAAQILGAVYHESFCNDLEITYNFDMLSRLTAIVREVKPAIVLAQSPFDYMEDHINACRLAVSAAFSRGMPNLKSMPNNKAFEGDVTLYHAMPYGLRGALRQVIVPGCVVNTTPVFERKMQALAAHKSQQNWLDVSQGHNSYLAAMEQMSLAVGAMSEHYLHAEGWQRHLHLGFCNEESDPLRDALGADYWLNVDYELNLTKGKENIWQEERVC